MIFLANWLPPKKAAQYLKEQRKINPKTVTMGEKAIRTLIENGFPHIALGVKELIDVDNFQKNLDEFSKRQHTQSDHTTNGIRKIIVN